MSNQHAWLRPVVLAQCLHVALLQVSYDFMDFWKVGKSAYEAQTERRRCGHIGFLGMLLDNKHFLQQRHLSFLRRHQKHNMGCLLLSRVGVSDNTAKTLRNLTRSRAPHVQNSKNPHAILAAKPPIFGALFWVLDVWNSISHKSFPRFLQCYH